jgi:hypothetical protein
MLRFTLKIGNETDPAGIPLFYQPGLTKEGSRDCWGDRRVIHRNRMQIADK